MRLLGYREFQSWDHDQDRVRFYDIRLLEEAPNRHIFEYRESLRDGKYKTHYTVTGGSIDMRRQWRYYAAMANEQEAELEAIRTRLNRDDDDDYDDDDERVEHEMPLPPCPWTEGA